MNYMESNSEDITTIPWIALMRLLHKSRILDNKVLNLAISCNNTVDRDGINP